MKVIERLLLVGKANEVSNVRLLQLPEGTQEFGVSGFVVQLLGFRDL